MRRSNSLAALVCGAAQVSVVFVADAQELKPARTALIPQSSVRKSPPGFEETLRASTNVAVVVPSTPIGSLTAAAEPPAPYLAETPASIACVYGLVPKAQGCNPNLVSVNSSGGGKVIAIVDAFDAPNIVNDLKVFSERFDLPAADFTVVYADGNRPSVDKGWELEISADVEWAHAIAPNAKIILIEAIDDQVANLFSAIDKAADLVAKEGGGEISISWSVSEFVEETSNDPIHFSKTGVAYFAATGDAPGVNYPASSGQVVAVGGTTIVRDGSGSLIGERPWPSAGAGLSAFEKRPPYQDSISSIVGTQRGIADLAAVADAAAGGVWVYRSGWLHVGGTSVATPIVAAIANLGGRFAVSSTDELVYAYSNAAKYNKILSGACGPGGVYTSTAGWGYCTGIGSPNAKDAL